MSNSLPIPTEPIDAKVANDAIANAIMRTMNHISLNIHSASRYAANTGVGVYIGLAGIALMEDNLSRYASSMTSLKYFPSAAKLAEFRDDHLKTSLNFIQRKGGRKPVPSRMSFLETDVGVATLILLRILDSPDNASIFFQEHWAFCFALVQSAVDAATKILDSDTMDLEDWCELLYGRAGLLYALLRIRKLLDSANVSSTPQNASSGINEIRGALWAVTKDETLLRVVRAIIKIGRNGSKEYEDDFAKRVAGGVKELPESVVPPLIWSWHGKRYLGAAHGVAGILHVLFSCPRKVVEPFVPELTQTLEWLVDLQDPNTGNWPSKAPTAVAHGRVYSDRDELVQWCHGASGMLPLLSTVLKRVNLDDRLRSKVIFSLQAGAQIVYRNGYLRKGIGICHGVAGSVFALLAASDVLDQHPVSHVDGIAKASQVVLNDVNTKYLSQAVHLAFLAVEWEVLTKEGKMHTPDRPWSLYEGAAGMCCAWIEVLTRLEGNGLVVCGIPGFDDV